MRYSWRQQRICSARCNACLYALLYFAPCCDCCASIRLFLVARFRWCKDLHTGENMAQRRQHDTEVRKYVRLRNLEMLHSGGIRTSPNLLSRAPLAEQAARHPQNWLWFPRPARGPGGADGAAQQRATPRLDTSPTPAPGPRPHSHQGHSDRRPRRHHRKLARRARSRNTKSSVALEEPLLNAATPNCTLATECERVFFTRMAPPSSPLTPAGSARRTDRPPRSAPVC
jgi:hypothetical protein